MNINTYPPFDLADQPEGCDKPSLVCKQPIYTTSDACNDEEFLDDLIDPEKEFERELQIHERQIDELGNAGDAPVTVSYTHLTLPTNREV